MNPTLQAWTLLIARLLMASLFAVAGLGKLAHSDATAAYMQATGVPGVLLWPTIAFELGAALVLALGCFTRYAGWALAGFCVATALIFHRQIGDPIQQLMLLKNLVMAGGFLALSVAGSGALSVDGRRA